MLLWNNKGKKKGLSEQAFFNNDKFRKKLTYYIPTNTNKRSNSFELVRNWKYKHFSIQPNEDPLPNQLLS